MRECYSTKQKKIKETKIAIMFAPKSTLTVYKIFIEILATQVSKPMVFIKVDALKQGL